MNEIKGRNDEIVYMQGVAIMIVVLGHVLQALIPPGNSSFSPFNHSYVSDATFMFISGCCKYYTEKKKCNAGFSACNIFD